GTGSVDGGLLLRPRFGGGGPRAQEEQDQQGDREHDEAVDEHAERGVPSSTPSTEATPSVRDPYRVAATADMIGMPMVKPICWVMVASPVTSPCSWSGTPEVAVTV